MISPFNLAISPFNLVISPSNSRILCKALVSSVVSAAACRAASLSAFAAATAPSSSRTLCRAASLSLIALSLAVFAAATACWVASLSAVTAVTAFFLFSFVLFIALFNASFSGVPLFTSLPSNLLNKSEIMLLTSNSDPPGIACTATGLLAGTSACGAPFLLEISLATASSLFCLILFAVSSIAVCCS